MNIQDHNGLNVAHVCDEKLTEGNVRSGATINGISGIHFISVAAIDGGILNLQCLLIFPDGISLTGIDASHSSIENLSKSKDAYWSHTLAKADREKLEAVGVALLPGASYRPENGGSLGSNGKIHYWTATCSEEYEYPYFIYSSTKSHGTGVFKKAEEGTASFPRTLGLAVRLVKDVK